MTHLQALRNAGIVTLVLVATIFHLAGNAQMQNSANIETAVAISSSLSTLQIVQELIL